MKVLDKKCIIIFCPFFLDSITMVEAGVIPVTPLRPSGSWWIQVILYQINKILSQLTQNMTTECYMNYMFSTCYFASNCSECKQKFKTILCKVDIQFYGIFWVNWRVNKDIWQISSLATTLIMDRQLSRQKFVNNFSNENIKAGVSREMMS